MTDMPAPSGDQGRLAVGPVVLTLAEDSGGSLSRDLLPSDYRLVEDSLAEHALLEPVLACFSS